MKRKLISNVDLYGSETSKSLSLKNWAAPWEIWQSRSISPNLRSRYEEWRHMLQRSQYHIMLICYGYAWQWKSTWGLRPSLFPPWAASQESAPARGPCSIAGDSGSRKTKKNHTLSGSYRPPCALASGSRWVPRKSECSSFSPCGQSTSPGMGLGGNKKETFWARKW